MVSVRGHTACDELLMQLTMVTSYYQGVYVCMLYFGFVGLVILLGRILGRVAQIMTVFDFVWVSLQRACNPPWQVCMCGPASLSLCAFEAAESRQETA